MHTPSWRHALPVSSAPRVVAPWSAPCQTRHALVWQIVLERGGCVECSAGHASSVSAGPLEGA